MSASSSSSSSSSQAIQKRQPDQLPRMLSDGEMPAFVTVASGVEERDVVADDLSHIFDVLNRQNVQVAGTASMSAELYRDRALKRFRQVDFVPRAEEQAYLREPAPGSGDRPCIRDEECEGRQIPGTPEPFTLVEHLTAEQRAHPPAKRQFCIMCKRHTATMLYIQARCEGTDMSALFNTHANYVNSHGEYTLGQSLIATGADSYGVLAPVVAHCRAWYQYYLDPKTGLRFFLQRGYRDVQDSDAHENF
jgi:hypothetical protein